MDISTSEKDEQIRSQPIGGASAKASGPPKPTVATKKLARTVLQPNRHFKEVSNDIGLLARIVGLSPGKISQETKADLVGDLIHQAAALPMPKVARQRSNPELDVSKQPKGNQRPNTPQLDKQEQEEKQEMPSLQQTKRNIKKEKELQEEGLSPFAQARPTRSNFKAPPIGALPKNPIERKRQDQKTFKDIAAELQKFKEQKAKRDKEREELRKKEQLEFEKREKELQNKMFELD
jgi:hypothetical protein